MHVPPILRSGAHLLAVGLALLASSGVPAHAQLTNLGTFDPSNASGLCGVGLDPTTGNIWVYDCFSATIQEYSSAGTFLSEIPQPGGSADDVDIEFAPEEMALGLTVLPTGTLLFINGESGVAEVYALDKSDGTVLATLVTAFGVGHVVGGGYHPGRDSLFLVQDNVAGGTNGNRVAEVDRVSGAVLDSFQVSAAGYSVSYGDLDIALSGNLLLVSSIETTLAEFTPSGGYVQELALPSGVSSLCGLATDGTDLEGWVAGTGGPVWRLGGLPSCGAESYCTAGTSASGCQALLGAAGTPSATAATGFVVTAGGVEGQKDGLFFYGSNGGQANPWGNGTSYQCVVPPTIRTPALSSGGTLGGCDGSMARDMNAYWTAFPQKDPGAGALVHLQLWYRDPANTSNQTTSLSDGLTFAVCP
jgi:hypothetical protein